ncbi:hypothetical protein SAMN05421788_104380 [Filimonas lacunae]|uniref:Uncharacterized protein n=1 Tax=Filimonas lacunae TaxID=477680 RepID=A0A1N7Q4R0_9BACT|nr:hypothetical protein SAMN05421788_104380 [Filimonas lacunae]
MLFASKCLQDKRGVGVRTRQSTALPYKGADYALINY